MTRRRTTGLILASLIATSRFASAQVFTDADPFSLSIYGEENLESSQYIQTWDAGFDFGANGFQWSYEERAFTTQIKTDINFYVADGDLHQPTALPVDNSDNPRRRFPKLNNPDLGLGVGGVGLDPREGDIVFYSSIRLGFDPDTELPNEGRIAASIGAGAVDGRNDLFPRYTETNINWNGGELRGQPLAAQGATSYAGSNASQLDIFETNGANGEPIWRDQWDTDGVFDPTKYVHHANGIRLINAAGDYEITTWYRTDTQSDWVLAAQHRGVEGGGVANLGDVGVDHPQRPGVKQGFVNGIGFVNLRGGAGDELFYGRHEITQTASRLLTDTNYDGATTVADLFAAQDNQGAGDLLTSVRATTIQGEVTGDHLVGEDDLRALIDAQAGNGAGSTFAGGSASASATYNPVTGEIRITTSGVNAFNVTSGVAGDVDLLVGSNLDTSGLTLDGSSTAQADEIGGFNFLSAINATDVSLGAGVARAGLSAGDLKLRFGAGDNATEVVDLTLVSALAGDFSGDGVVDAADYTVWRDNLGTVYSQSDYSDWVANFGSAASSNVAGVPEPTATIMVVALAALAGLRRQS